MNLPEPSASAETELTNALDKLRVTGPGFSGQGANKIMFDPNAAGADGDGASALTFVTCIDGEAIEVRFPGATIIG